MKFRNIFGVGLLFGFYAIQGILPSPALAHFVWIETPATIAPGEKSEARLYFGESHEFLREEAGGRLDNRENMKVWAVDSKGERQSVSFKRQVNFYSAKVLVEKPGRYNLIAMDLESEVVDGTKFVTVGIFFKPMFYARAGFLAFEPGRVSEREAEITEMMDLDIVPVTSHLNPLKGTITPKVGEEIVLQVFYKGEPVAKAKPLALSPIGWVKELRTNSMGMTRFTPLWPGTYVIDYVHMDKTPGEYEGKSYEGVRHRATLTIQVENPHHGKKKRKKKK
ncbi:MAG: DUF4198 domain-containing protein [Nitrospiria bacterium]